MPLLTIPAERRIALAGTLGLLQDEGVIESVEIDGDWTFVIDGRRYDIDGAARFARRLRRT